MNSTYDYLIVGAGLYGSVFAHEATKQGKRCLLVERRDHIGGNCYTKTVNDINVHWYGAHIFHTSNEQVWQYVTRLASFNNYINSPIANYKGELYNLPFNMNTFTKLWPDVHTPQEARERIAQQQAEYASVAEPRNLTEQGMKLAGRDIFTKLVKGYSEKQWGRPAEQILSYSLSWERRASFSFARRGIFRTLRMPICPICAVLITEDNTSLLPFIFITCYSIPACGKFMHKHEFFA